MFAYCENCPVVSFDPNGYETCDLYGQLKAVPLPIAPGVITGTGILGVILGWIFGAEADEESKRSDLAEDKDFARTVTQEQDEKYSVHHIVAKLDPRAKPARNVLRSVGFDPFIEGLNLAVIPQRVHAGLHTDAYYQYVNARFAGLEGNKPAIIYTLASLQFEILLYCETGYKRW